LQDILPVQEAVQYQHLTSDCATHSKNILLMSGKIQTSATNAAGQANLAINP
jgi:hypothetical protein